MYKAQKQALTVAQLREIFTDEDEFLNSVASATTFNEQMALALEDLQEDDAMAESLDLQIRAMQERKKRIESRIDSRRNGMLQAMRIAGINKLELPRGTLSISATPQKVVVVDELALPDDYWAVTRKPDLRAIKQHIDEYGELAGCALSNGGETLKVRV